MLSSNWIDSPQKDNYFWQTIKVIIFWKLYNIIWSKKNLAWYLEIIFSGKFFVKIKHFKNDTYIIKQFSQWLSHIIVITKMQDRILSFLLPLFSFSFSSFFPFFPLFFPSSFLSHDYYLENIILAIIDTAVLFGGLYLRVGLMVSIWQ